MYHTLVSSGDPSKYDGQKVTTVRNVKQQFLLENGCQSHLNNICHCNLLK